MLEIETTVTRWRARYDWPADYKGLKLYPEVYAATELEARELAAQAFRGLVDVHAGDWSWQVFFPVKDKAFFDPAQVSVEDIGLPLYKAENFQVAPMSVPDLAEIWRMNYDVLDRR